MQADIRGMFRVACVIALLLLSSCAAAIDVAAVYEDPRVAYPFDAASIQRPDVLRCAGQLLELGGYGMRPFERAAFLVLREDGALDCRVWPATFEVREATWDGEVPRGVTAIVHTHPRRLSEPSPHDIGEARTSGIPIFVVTPGTIALVTPQGEIRTFPIEAGRSTSRNARREAPTDFISTEQAVSPASRRRVKKDEPQVTLRLARGH